MPTANPRSINGMARRLGKSHHWASQHLPASAQPDADGSYSDDCFNYLEQLAANDRKVPPLGQNYTLPQAAEKLLCARGYLVKMLEQFGLPGVRQYRGHNERVINGLSRATVKKLSQIMPPFAPTGYSTVYGLRQELGWPSDTIKARLGQSQVRPLRYRSPLNGKICNHYNTENARIVLGVKPNFVPPGGDYLTASFMGALLGRTHYWIMPRLANPIIAATAQSRLDDSGVVRLHYPREVFLELRRQSDLQRLGGKQAA